MAVARGTRLGPYEILNLAGRGGMGEVYVARDTRLGRRVAIKIAKGALLGDADAERRFDEEMRLAAMLDHPRICTVHDIGQTGDIRYFVMELLEGESLAARLARGAIPLPELLEYAVQIAAALAHAHKHRVLHRDVKPGNVFLTPSGVKVLDFGLAKVRAQLPGEAASDIGTLPTRPFPLTRPGLVQGTPEYFAPERLDGREGDHRSDIFAFGALLYEMATGRRPFDAPTPAALFSAIMASDPAPMIGHGSATPELEWVIHRCLKKDPAARWESMSDVEAVLRWLASRVGTQSAVETTRDHVAQHSRRSHRHAQLADRPGKPRMTRGRQMRFLMLLAIAWFASFAARAGQPLFGQVLED
jgi:eukaryotic-like serine/threonine-protein kinase